MNLNHSSFPCGLLTILERRNREVEAINMAPAKQTKSEAVDTFTHLNLSTVPACNIINSALPSFDLAWDTHCLSIPDVRICTYKIFIECFR